MADRSLRDNTTGGVKVTEALDGATPIVSFGLDSENLASATAIENDDLIPVFVDLVPKKVAVSTLLGSQTYVRPYLVRFGGTLTEATGASNYQIQQRRIAGVSGKTNKIVGLTIVGADGLTGSSGTTTVAASNGDYSVQGESGISAITATINYDAYYSSLVTGSIAGSGTPPVFYVFIPSAPTGGHSGLWVQVDIEVSPA